jgi:transposase
MWIIGCDMHARFQQIAALNTETGELVERRLEHQGGEAQTFYESLSGSVRVGMEASVGARWFEKLLMTLGHELWIGNASEIRAAVVRQQKTDARDASHLLRLLAEGRFPRVWVPSLEERDVRQLLLHRNRLVRMRTALRNQLSAVARSHGLDRKRKLWNEEGRQQLNALPLDRWAAVRRHDLTSLLDSLETRIMALSEEIKAEAERRPQAVRLMMHPGVGPITALGFVLTLGPIERFTRSKQVVSYLGLNPREYSSGGNQRLGSISKQGNKLARWLLVEAAQTAARYDSQLHRLYVRLKLRRGSKIAKIAVARKLAVRLYWMLRSPDAVAQRVSTQGSPRRNLVA